MILSGLWNLIEALSLGIEEPEEKSYADRETFIVWSKKAVVDREG